MFQNSEQQLIALGEFLRLARKRRGWRQEDVAQRLNIGIDTVKRAEKGHKGLSVGYLFDMLSLYQRLESFSDVINPENDLVGISTESQRLPQRISAKRYDRDF